MNIDVYEMSMEEIEAEMERRENLIQGLRKKRKNQKTAYSQLHRAYINLLHRANSMEKKLNGAEENITVDVATE